MDDSKRKRPWFPSEVADPRSGPYFPARSRGYLPHLYRDDASYFVTFCLADVAETKKAIRERLTGSGRPDEIASFTEPGLSAGECLLSNDEMAQDVESALLHFQGERYGLSAWCVMPNHVHVVVTCFAGFSLGKILHSWKSFTAHAINRRLGRRGPVWQEESFDHVIRNVDELNKFVTYTEMNPVSAGLVARAEDWPFGSARLHVRPTSESL
jgi:REP element-mobilizing transposase RayT